MEQTPGKLFWVCQFAALPEGSGRIMPGVETKKALKISAFLLVDRPGFEPGQTAPKTVVLPLHHRSIPFGWQNYKDFFEVQYFFGKNPDMHVRNAHE